MIKKGNKNEKEVYNFLHGKKIHCKPWLSVPKIFGSGSAAIFASSVRFRTRMKKVPVRDNPGNLIAHKLRTLKI